MADENKNTENQVFRQKSMDRVTSPENLNNIIKVANPGVWILIAATIALLIGALCWGFLGRLQTSVPVAVTVENNVATFYVKEADILKVKEGQEVKFEGYTCKLGTIPKRAIRIADKIKDDYVKHVLGLTENDWVFVITSPCEAEDGVYVGNVITESIAPISLIFN